MASNKITTLFLDIGGVLLTDGWGRDSRAKAIEHFKLDATEMNERNQQSWAIFESGKMSMDEYLQMVIFYTPRKFSKPDFIAFMFNQSKPLKGSIEYFIRLKKANGLKVIALSNEARELNEYRIQKYNLNNLFDAYISSCYVGLRKPDVQIFKLAIDISQTAPEQAVFVDDRILSVEVATGLGIPSLHYCGLNEAKKYFKKAGLK